MLDHVSLEQTKSMDTSAAVDTMIIAENYYERALAAGRVICITSGGRRGKRRS